jgi:hypothetical protein
VDPVEQWKRRAEAFASVAHEQFATHETSGTSRVVSLSQTRKDLAALSLLQESLLTDALRCVELGLHRAAHVMAWAAFMDLIEERMASDGLKAVRVARPAWSKYKTVEELRENVVEYQLLEAARDIGLLSKNATKSLLGLLSKRNECAHPSGYEPGLNESLGYISELLTRMKTLQAKTL